MQSNNLKQWYKITIYWNWFWFNFIKIIVVKTKYFNIDYIQIVYDAMNSIFITNCYVKITIISKWHEHDDDAPRQDRTPEICKLDHDVHRQNDISGPDG